MNNIRNYFFPSTMGEALAMLADKAGKGRVVAGSTDLYVDLNVGRWPNVDTLIDISRVNGLNRITTDGHSRIHIGPMVTHNRCAVSHQIQKSANALAYACWSIGAPQIRNVATVAGNLATASPAGDTIPPLMALNAEVRLDSAGNTRFLRIDDFIRGPRQIAMHPDEIITDIIFTIPAIGTKSIFEKIALRKAQAISVASICIFLRVEGQQIQDIAITLGAVAPTVIHAFEAEEWLVGKILTKDTISIASRLVASATRPIDDIRATKEYRMEVIRAITQRILESFANDKAQEQCTTEFAKTIRRFDKRLEHRKHQLPHQNVEGSQAIDTIINGDHYRILAKYPNLLGLIRDGAGLKGTKEGCGEGECGACTVVMNGKTVMSCILPSHKANGSEITTIEGLSCGADLHQVQHAFIDEGAVQCGYCTPGFIMSATNLLEMDPHPEPRQILEALTGNLCRCTGYYSIINAIKLASEKVED